MMTTTGGGRDTPSPVNVDYAKYPPHLPIQGSQTNKFKDGGGGEHSLVSLNPLWKQRLHWDVILSVLFFYNATVIPIYICYGIGESIYDPIFWINRFVDLCFFGSVHHFLSFSCHSPSLILCL